MRRETEEILEILHKNKERVQTQKTIEKQIYLDRKRIDRKKKKAIVSGVILLVLLAIVLIMLGYSNDKFVKDCVKGGLDRNVCEISA